MIQDSEMRALFAAESEEHLEQLDTGLLGLETNPDDKAILAETFRHAHSLKGSSRMLGLSDIEALAHNFEEALGAAVRGQEALSSERIERLLKALDTIRSLVRQATTGQAADVDVQSVKSTLHTATPVAPVRESFSTFLSTFEIETPTFTPSNGVPKEEDAFVTFIEEAPPIVVQEPPPVRAPVPPSPTPDQISALQSPSSSQTESPSKGARWNTETMRVEPAKLDALLAMAGELVVSTTRATRGKSDLQVLRELREEWSRSATDSRRVLREVTVESGSHSRAVRELERIVARDAERMEALGRLVEKLTVASNDLDRLGTVVGEMEASIRAVRLLPLSTVFSVFPRAVRDLSRASGKAVRLLLEGGETHADKRILEALKDPLMHLVRNSVDHGIELTQERSTTIKPATATVKLRGYQTSHSVVVEVEDDGRGLNAEAIRRSALRKGLKTEAELAALSTREVYELIFEPGFSTRSQVNELSGRGVGLDVVRSNVQRLRGTVEVESRPGEGCLFRLSLPVTLATTRVLLVQVGEQTYAIPIESVRGIHLVTPNDIYRFRGRETVSWNGRPTSIARLSEILNLPSETSNADRPSLILESGEESVGVLVDVLLEEQEIILKPLGALSERLPHLAGATILETGEVCLVLNSAEIVRSATRHNASLPPVQIEFAPTPKRVLLVEDSITTRTQEKRILEGAGYEVVTAVDGVDGWNKFTEDSFDAVVTDIEMPRMTGLALTARIRQDAQYSDMPIILVTSLSSEEDRARGADVGANAYIVKSAFDQRDLLDALRRLA